MEVNPLPADAVELTGEVASLVSAGVPLASSLRALAEEVPQARLRRGLLAVADRMQQGASLEAAVEAESKRFPAHFSRIIQAAAQSQRPGEVLETMVLLERRRTVVRQEIWRVLAYPTLLFGIMTAIYVFFSLAVAPQLGQLFRDFGADLPQITKALLWLCSPITALVMLGVGSALLAATVVLAILTPKHSWAQTILYAVPVVGPLWRYCGLAEFSRLTALLLDLQVRLPDAFRVLGDGLPDSSLRAGCRRLVRHIENGMPLEEALGRLPAFPQRLQPMVGWGQRWAALPDSFRASAEMFDGHVVTQQSFLDAIVLPVMLVLVAGWVGFMTVGLMMPLISLITKLSG